jgi:hypothetical protein
MRRIVFLRTFAYLLGGLILVDIAVAAFSKTWRAYDPVFYRDRLAALQRQPRDLVVVGGSPAMSGFDVDIFQGISWRGTTLKSGYNMGLPMGTTTDIYHAVLHGLPTPPKLLVYGISATDLNESRVEPLGPKYLMGLDDVARFAKSWPHEASGCIRNWSKEHASQLWQLYYHRDGIRLWAAAHAESLWPGLCPDGAAEAGRNLERSAALESGRGVTRVGPAPQEVRLDVLKQRGTVPDFDFLGSYGIDHHLRYLQRLIDWAEQHGTALILVDVPVPADLDVHRYAGEYRAYRQKLAEVARTRHVRLLLATREAVGISDADFSDLIHLNGDGATRLSRWVRRTIESLPASEQDLRASLK